MDMQMHSIWICHTYSGFFHFSRQIRKKVKSDPSTMRMKFLIRTVEWKGERELDILM